MLEFKNFTIAYEQEILTNLNLSFEPGQITVVTGASGTGKSSFLKVINGIIPHFQAARLAGDLTYQGQNLLELDMAQRSRFISTVFQNPKTQFYAVNSTDEMAFALENRNLPREEILERIRSYTQLLGMEDLLDRPIFTLSGGEKQLLAITSVACMDNDIYMFDEPSSSLDRQAIARFKEVLVKLKAMGKTIIIAEHRLYYFRDLLDKLVLFEEGEAKVYPAAKVNQSLADQHGLRSLTEIKKTDLIVENFSRKSLFDQGPQESGRLLCQNYSYSYGAKPVLASHFSFDQGLYFIIGSNGVGKSTFLRCLLGLNKKFKGQTFYQGQPLKPSYQWLTAVMQDVNYQLFTESVWSEISIVSQDDEAKKAALAQLNLLDKVDRHPQSLSGGEKQRLLLAMARVADKPLLVFDEPTSGLCRGQMEQLIDNLHQFVDQGKTIILVTHDYELIQKAGGQIIEFIGHTQPDQDSQRD
ncbi:ABC transporter ATP-binding protein [Streptococcus oricebi]|uniref:ABC transporter ATP-binding protein n=1 Tax=Streptococcus oricebi TaxID=1547447 RepID=A0ABS5B7L5_9STRE|nr:ABC transporter ATP-binding protein [Streptococcus oricebi]MBP2624004.1 ABC transporter ATP-binding protein [Streptococcus oricebi]